jgi:hypothetical protein
MLSFCQFSEFDGCSGFLPTTGGAAEATSSSNSSRLLFFATSFNNLPPCRAPSISRTTHSRWSCCRCSALHLHAARCIPYPPPTTARNDLFLTVSLSSINSNWVFRRTPLRSCITPPPHPSPPPSRAVINPPSPQPLTPHFQQAGDRRRISSFAPDRGPCQVYLPAAY